MCLILSVNFNFRCQMKVIQASSLENFTDEMFYTLKVIILYTMVRTDVIDRSFLFFGRYASWRALSSALSKTGFYEGWPWSYKDWRCKDLRGPMIGEWDSSLCHFTINTLTPKQRLQIIQNTITLLRKNIRWAWTCEMVLIVTWSHTNELFSVGICEIADIHW